MICFWKIANKIVGGMIEYNTARIISIWFVLMEFWNEKSLTMTVSLLVPLSSRYGIRKSLYAAQMAKIATTIRMGLDSGRMTRVNT